MSEFSVQRVFFCLDARYGYRGGSHTPWDDLEIQMAQPDGTFKCPSCAYLYVSFMFSISNVADDKSCRTTTLPKLRQHCRKSCCDKAVYQDMYEASQAHTATFREQTRDIKGKGKAAQPDRARGDTTFDSNTSASDASFFDSSNPRDTLLIEDPDTSLDSAAPVRPQTEEDDILATLAAFSQLSVSDVAQQAMEVCQLCLVFHERYQYMRFFFSMA